MTARRIPSWKLALVAGTFAGSFVLDSPLSASTPGPRFVRGNVDQDGAVAVSDAVQILNHLFLGAAAPACLDAADVDDSGVLGITDAVRVLVFLFAGSAVPASPYPDCGEDTTPGLGCASFPACDAPPATAISGRTVDQDGVPLLGAKVSGGARTVYSGPAGLFELADLRGGLTIRVIATLGERTAERNVFRQGPSRVDIGDVVLQPPSGSAACENAVGRALDYGCGRVFAWGDEHILFGEYLPASAAFWENTLEWLAGDACGGGRRTRLCMATAVDPGLQSLIARLGFTLVPPEWASSFEPMDILVTHAYSGPSNAAALTQWVEEGGALMTLAGGGGNTQPQECDHANQWTAPFGIEYDCTHDAPSGPVSSFEAHAISSGLGPANAPFVGGRLVAEAPGTGSDVVARSGDCHPREISDCRKPAMLHDGTPPSGEVSVESDCQSALIADTDEATAGPELHIIGIYESRSREVSVRVDREGRHVLALTAYGGDCNGTMGEHHWTVTAGPGATIEKVILSGIEPPTATVPEGTAVESYSAEKWFWVGYGDDCGGGDTPKLIANVEAAAGLKMRSFHGCYEASAFRFVGGTR